MQKKKQTFHHYVFVYLSFKQICSLNNILQRIRSSIATSVKFVATNLQNACKFLRAFKRLELFNTKID